MNNTSQQFESYVPVYDVCPENWDEGRQFIVEQLKKISNAVNIREIGWFLDEELLSGKQFIPGVNSGISGGTEPQYRTVFRKVVNTGTLPNATTTRIPHGITFDSNFTLVQLYGAGTEPPAGATAIPLPFVDIDPNKNIQLYMDGTDVIIVTLANQSKYTKSYVVIEYLMEA